MGENYQGPKTNLRYYQVFSRPANISENTEFSVGKHQIEFLAENELNHQVACTFIVTIKGEKI